MDHSNWVKTRLKEGGASYNGNGVKLRLNWEQKHPNLDLDQFPSRHVTPGKSFCFTWEFFSFSDEKTGVSYEELLC